MGLAGCISSYMQQPLIPTQSFLIRTTSSGAIPWETRWGKWSSTGSNTSGWTRGPYMTFLKFSHIFCEVSFRQLMSLQHTYTHDFLYQLLHAAVPFARISDISRLLVSEVMMFLPLSYPQCSYTSWKIYGFHLELFFVQIAKYLERTFNGKSEPCLRGKGCH